MKPKIDFLINGNRQLLLHYGSSKGSLHVYYTYKPNWGQDFIEAYRFADKLRTPQATVGGSVMPILSESTLPFLSLIVFLPRPPGNQMHRPGDSISPFCILHDQMNMI
jgi:hypothetical protein